MELVDVQREYLADVETVIVTMREQAHALAMHGDFKTAFPALLFHAHQLKGSGGSLGFPRISAVAGAMTQELNAYLIERPTKEELSRKIVALTDELAREVHSAACPASSSS
ncbi:MAG TPA: Hpt domain-containing protein [Thermoanaerobaculia bacterium]|nr:Hpt domain-containing protein [Thermoanaerobaculia bacterium]